MNLSERLKELVAESGRHANEIAKEAGITAAALSLIVNGHHKNPGIRTVSALARALRVTVDDLLHGNETKFCEPQTKYLASCIRCSSESHLVLVPHYRFGAGVAVEGRRMVGWVFSCERCLPGILEGEIQLSYKTP